MSSWPIKLYEIIDSPSFGNESIINFINDNIPFDENNIFDFKKELYLYAENPETENMLKGKFIKTCCSLANSSYEGNYRYILIGFSNNHQKYKGVRFSTDKFKGIDKLGAEYNNKKHIIEIDEAEIQNLLKDYLDPIPNIKRHIINYKNNKGCILIIERIKRPPIVVKKSLKISDGKKSIIHKGQAFTRKGSRNTLMRNNEFRNLIEERDEIITEKIKEFADGLSHVVGLSADQLRELELNVSSQKEGIPVKEVITTNPAKSDDEKLTTAVKNWNTTGEFLNSRKAIYKFYLNASNFNYNNEKLKFLIISSFKKCIPGGIWLLKYENNYKKLFNDIIENYLDYYVTLIIQKILLVMGFEKLLKRVKEKTDFSNCKAKEYLNYCDKDIYYRIKKCANSTINVKKKTYRSYNLFYESEMKELNQLSNILIEELLKSDESTIRLSFRNIELIRLGKHIQSEN